MPPARQITAVAPLLLLLLAATEPAASAPQCPAPSGMELQSSASTQTGYASYYAFRLHGRRTANGETFDRHALTAAHRTIPFGTTVRVTNIANGRTVLVRINDRGPFRPERIIDLSPAAARTLGIIRTGTALVRVEPTGAP